MSLSNYVSTESLEKVAVVVMDEVILPGLEKLVADSSNPYDDMALAAAKPMLLALVEKIHTPEETPAS